MKKLIFLVAFFEQVAAQPVTDKFVLVIHGGAGTILKSQMSPAREKAYTEALDMALQEGYAILKNNGSALDAVEACVRYMEDNPLFNAGKGAVFTSEGKNELDAAIMNGKTLAAGSVAGVTTIKNPISAARAVMEKSPHVMMAGKGAEQFAEEYGLEIVDPSYFYTEERWKNLQMAKKSDSILTEFMKTNKSLKTNNDSINKNFEKYRLRTDTVRKVIDIKPKNRQATVNQPENKDYKYGTVGAVALDRYGNLAAATSTGGMTNKKFGRIGDAPIIGAGTYANNNTAAISCTGWGEYYIRLVLAKTVSDMMEFGKKSLQQATDEMVIKRLPALGGDGGLIAVDKKGNIAMPFCTEGMYRGYVKGDGKRVVMIYRF